jgi:hypothetical protein
MTEQITEVVEISVMADSLEEAHRIAYQKLVEECHEEAATTSVNDREFDVSDGVSSRTFDDDNFEEPE